MEDGSANSTFKRIAFIGNYMPRQCGIATFTTDLCEAIAAEYAGTTCIALPVNDTAAGYAYPARVRFELTEKDIESYPPRRRFPEYQQRRPGHACSIRIRHLRRTGRQPHPGPACANCACPSSRPSTPFCKDPDPDQRRVLEEVASLSDRLVVMSERGTEFLQDDLSVCRRRRSISSPTASRMCPLSTRAFNKDLFGVEGKIVLLSFGLLSANKGIENVIAALPAILARYPNVVYIVLGATHPHVIRHEGETYRLSLQWLAQEKGVESHVIFYNRFVSLEELIEFIGAADIYITPYLNGQQITSGTLAYTLGAGKAVISTPYWYAEEMLAEGRGVLVPFRDPAALGGTGHRSAWTTRPSATPCASGPICSGGR